MKRITENLYKSNGCYVVTMEEDSIMVIYAPKDKNGNQTPYDATGSKPAPSFCNMLVL